MTLIASRRAAVLAFMLVVSLAGSVRAEGTFHSGGVGSCGGCHVSHEEPGVPTGPHLLRGATPTDTCLACHATADGNSWGTGLLAPGPLYGGGAFIFLTEENLNDGAGGSDPANWIGGNHAGHNVVSPLRGVSADPDHPVSPGGVYPSANLTCTSCHDPHDQAGNFRMLYANNSPPSMSMGYEFLFDAPPIDAVGIDVAGAPESPSNHSAYRSGVSVWCETCHDRPHQGGGGGGGGPTSTGTSGTGDITNIGSAAPGGGSTGFQHRTDGNISNTRRAQYDTYDGTGFESSADPNLSYIPEVALEFPSATVSFTGPTPQDAQLSCFSCHRAHASSAPKALRWDQEIATWAEEGVLSGSYPIPNPYDTTAGNAQRPLCDKCHGTAN